MTQPNGPCPFLNRDDSRCRSRLTLVNLTQAFSVCIAAYTGCAVHAQIKGEDVDSGPVSEFVPLTLVGHVQALARSA